MNKKSLSTIDNLRRGGEFSRGRKQGEGNEAKDIWFFHVKSHTARPERTNYPPAVKPGFVVDDGKGRR